MITLHMRGILLFDESHQGHKSAFDQILLHRATCRE